MTDPLHSQNLVPFRKRRGPYHIPGMTGENEARALEVDHNLEPEEERFIRHYLGYADTLLKLDPGDVDAEEALGPAKKIEEIPTQKIALIEDALVKDNDQLSSFDNAQLNGEKSTEAA